MGAENITVSVRTFDVIWGIYSLENFEWESTFVALSYRTIGSTLHTSEEKLRN